MSVVMERGAQTHEQARSFDPQASVNLFSHDLMAHGMILPETRERVTDEELSYLTEGVDRAARTTFALKRQNGELVYFDKGNWRPYDGMLLTGMRVADEEARVDPRRGFLKQRAVADYQRGMRMQALKPGESMSWHSPYPEDMERLYGAKFMQDRGFFPRRKMGFLYRASCQADGSVILQSQTVDRSNDRAFAEALSNPHASMDQMVDRYDSVLGRGYYAGRLDSERHHNAWEMIRSQRDLVEYFLNGLEALARQKVAGFDVERLTKEHIYGVWALFKKRLDGESRTYEQKSVYGYSMRMRPDVAQEVAMARREFIGRGMVLIGCGGSITVLQGESDIYGADSSDVFSGIFGNESLDSGSDSDSMGPLRFKCLQGHWNRRPRNRKITRCRVKNCAEGSVGC